MSALKFICLIFLVTQARSSPIQPKNTEYRLPDGAVEVNTYDIELTLKSDVFETNQFSGVAEVLFKNMKETNEIKIHANKMTFSEIVLETVDGTQIGLQNEGNFEIDSATDILTLTTDTSLAQGIEYRLRFTYEAELRTNEMYGFYKSSYVAADGTTRYLGTTQFQPTHARKAFPCFDEPFYKAIFNIKIRHPNQYRADGNTVGTSVVDPQDNTALITTFASTPRMSSYIIAFVVSDFTCSAGEEIESGIPHQVCSRDEAASTREVAVDVGPKLTWALEEFTNIKYNESTIKKLDQFAIPDFSAGAMENWGLITYRETALLWDPLESSNRYKQRVETVISHELAHFWFGDLVTTKWWSDTFLNEGFATYFEYLATAEVEPTWEMEKQFVIEQLQPVLVSDSSVNSQALSAEASTPDQVSGRFSSISYNKGGSVIRMVAHFLGAEGFRNGIRKYLEDNKFGSTTPADLWRALTESTTVLPTSVSVIMDNWTYKAGYPVLQVKRNGDDVVVTQERFLISGTPEVTEKWYVPISYTTSTDSDKFLDTSPKVWLNPLTTNVNITDALKERDWIILNNQQTGFYRIDYDDNLWEKIKIALTQTGFDGIHELNRAQIVDDYYNFARAGLHSYSSFLDLIKFLKADSSYYPWYSAFTAFSSMLQRTGDEKIRAGLHEYIRELMVVLYNTVPFNKPNDDDQIYTHKRVLAVTWACNLEVKDCIDNSLAAFGTYRNTATRPDKNLRSVIYCNALRHSNDPGDWEYLWEQFGTSQIATEQVTILSALGCTKDDEIRKKYLSLSINSTSGIRQQDALSVFSAVYSGNPDGVDLAFDFLLENYEDIYEYYASMNSFRNLFSGLANRFTKKQQTDKLSDFIENTPNLPESVETAARGALSTALNNLEIIEQFEKELSQYFNVGSASSAEPARLGFATTVTTLMVLLYKAF
jgi:aminopeptidase N